MVKRMLIDATHSEETRVVVMDGTRLEEFDVETSTKKQNKGNIYLAKVVRVEPSLQAAFVDYGGNRHGFLAFSEIHPDYYQIPVADRERLLAEVQRHEHHDDDEAPLASEPPIDQPDAAAQPEVAHHGSEHSHEHDHHHDHDGGHDHHDHNHGYEPFDPNLAAQPTSSSETENSVPAQLSFLAPTISSETLEEEKPVQTAIAEVGTVESALPPDDLGAHGALESAASEQDFAANLVEETLPAESEGTPFAGSDDFTERLSQVEEIRVEERPIDTVGGNEEGDDDDDDDEVDDDEDSKRRRRFLASRHYKIQEVIKRRQIMLVQVVKEERGNKGAALTTYLSLAGRYCVLMPNSARGGGVSRKITNATDRRRLKSIMSELQPPKTAAVILRTAGAERSKPEIKRDYEYLMRTWDQIRENTLQSRAPALIHEEGNLIKRAIRDIYAKDIEDILVEGEEGYKTAKDFMRMLTPSHSKKVQRYDDRNISLFQRYQAETQLEAINTPVVQLRSGGSIVFGQTEALVAIDVNSGRATRERHIEETALKTNIEAADEIARQLRLRDLAGLVVIDFIDMEENRNNHAVERRLKEALKLDRARIQVGRISHFGLLELSRQRLRPSLIETNFRPCDHCGGTGLIRSTESSSIYALRMIEEEGMRRRSSELTVTVHPDVALYLLNYKRDQVASLEMRYGLRIFVLGDAHLIQPNLRIDRIKATRSQLEEAAAQQQALPPPSSVEDEPEIEEEIEAETEETDVEEIASSEPQRGDDQDFEGGRRGRGRRRRRRRGRGREGFREQGQSSSSFEPSHELATQPSRGFENEASADNSLFDAQSDETTSSPEDSVTHEAGSGEHGRDERGGRRRRRGRRGGRRRRREFGDQQGDASNHGEQPDEPADTFAADAQFDQLPPLPGSNDLSEASAPQAVSEETAMPRKRGFFSAIKETALSWTRNENGGESPAPNLPVEPTKQFVSEPIASPAPKTVSAETAPIPLPPAPPTPVVEEAPAGPPRKGWWNQPKA